MLGDVALHQVGDARVRLTISAAEVTTFSIAELGRAPNRGSVLISTYWLEIS